VSHRIFNLFGLGIIAAVAGCTSIKHAEGVRSSTGSQDVVRRVLEQQYVYDVLRYVYRWHFDSSYVLEAGRQDTLEVWARALHPELDEGDRSEFAELWIPAVKTKVELKRSDYEVPELKLQLVDRSFKVKRVTRQAKPPAARAQYQVRHYPLSEVREHLFSTRAKRPPIGEVVRKAGRDLILGFLDKDHPGSFEEDQIFHIAPVSTVCNDYWVFWETGRKVMLFSADMDLTNAGAAHLSQLKMDVIDLDKDVVASPKEVPGSNAFVTKDWVGRLFFNCILYGERVVLRPEQMDELRAGREAARK
jgi:hypothetical protein